VADFGSETAWCLLQSHSPVCLRTDMSAAAASNEQPRQVNAPQFGASTQKNEFCSGATCRLRVMTTSPTVRSATDERSAGGLARRDGGTYASETARLKRSWRRMPEAPNWNGRPYLNKTQHLLERQLFSFGPNGKAKTASAGTRRGG